MTTPTLRPVAAVPQEEVYALYDGADFLYKTVTPTTLDAREIDALVDERTRFLALPDKLAGLWSFRSVDQQSWGLSQFTGFYHLAYRLRGELPAECWVNGFEGILSYLTNRSDVVRVDLQVAEFDELGALMAETMGFTREGMIPDTLVLAGRSWGTTTYARTWSPS
jgi:hypothetical protein